MVLNKYSVRDSGYCKMYVDHQSYPSGIDSKGADPSNFEEIELT